MVPIRVSFIDLQLQMQLPLRLSLSLCAPFAINIASFCETHSRTRLLITLHFIGRDTIDIVRLINRRKLNGTEARRPSLMSLQKYLRVSAASIALAPLTLRRNAPSTQCRGPRLFIGRNNGDSPGTVPVYFIMLYVLGSSVDKKVTNPPPATRSTACDA